jgi:hypothetical protein
VEKALLTEMSYSGICVESDVKLQLTDASVSCVHGLSTI